MLYFLFIIIIIIIEIKGFIIKIMIINEVTIEYPKYVTYLVVVTQDM